MKEVLILGGAGFIGFNLAFKLSERDNHNITIADNLSRGQMDSSLKELLKKENVTFIEGDFTNNDDFSMLNKEYDYLYMLAAVVGVNNTLKMPSEIIRINTKLTMNVLEWLSKSQVKKVIFTSTSENYSGTIDKFNYQVPTPEDVPLSIIDISHPRYTYAVTKILGESGFLNYANTYGFECTIIRYHNVIGPRMGFKHVIPHLAERFLIKKENPFLMYGFDQTRSFCYIDDAIMGTISAAEYDESDGQIYHIGSSEEITIEELIRESGKFFNFDGTFEEAPTFPGSTMRRCPDSAKAKKHFGYSPKNSWKESLHKTLKWYGDFFANGNEAYESSFEKPNV